MKTKIGPLARVKAALISTVTSTQSTLISLTDGSFFARFFGTSSASGAVVSTDSALRVATVWRCINLIAGAIATLPINVYQDNADGGRVIASNHPLQFLLHSEPNNEQTAVEFFEFILLSLLLAGNAYVWKQYNSGVGGSRRILNLIPLVPIRVSVNRQQDNSLRYDYVDFNGNVCRNLSKDDVLHIKGPSLDGFLGLSPLSYAREVIGTTIAANTAGATVFKNGLKASGVLQSDQILTPKQREDLRSNMNTFGAANAGGVMTLEAGFKYQQITMSPADAQLLDTQKFNVEEICRWFGVPPHMVGSTSNSTSWGSGLEQQTLGFLTYCLRPWIARIEDAIKRSCFSDAEKAKGLYAEFSVEGLLRTDSAARASYYSSMTQNGIYTRDEVRRLENMPPKGGNAEVLTVQSALLPLDKLGEAAQTAPSKIEQTDPVDETRKV